MELMQFFWGNKQKAKTQNSIQYTSTLEYRSVIFHPGTMFPRSTDEFTVVRQSLTIDTIPDAIVEFYSNKAEVRPNPDALKNIIIISDDDFTRSDQIQTLTEQINLVEKQKYLVNTLVGAETSSESEICQIKKVGKVLRDWSASTGGISRDLCDTELGVFINDFIVNLVTDHGIARFPLPQEIEIGVGQTVKVFLNAAVVDDSLFSYNKNEHAIEFSLNRAPKKKDVLEVAVSFE